MIPSSAFHLLPLILCLAVASPSFAEKHRGPMLKLNLGICMDNEYSEDDQGYKMTFGNKSRHCDAVVYEKYVSHPPSSLSEAIAQELKNTDIFKNISGEFLIAGTDFSGSGFSVVAANRCEISGPVLLDLANYSEEIQGKLFVDTYLAKSKDHQFSENLTDYSTEELLFGKSIDLLELSPTVTQLINDLSDRWRSQSFAAMLPFILSNRINELKWSVTPLPLETTLGNQPGIDQATNAYKKSMKAQNCQQEQIDSYYDQATTSMGTIALYSPRNGVVINAYSWNRLGDLSKAALIVHESLRSLQLLDDLPIGQKSLQKFVAQFVLDPPPRDFPGKSEGKKLPQYAHLLEYLLFKADSSFNYELPVQYSFFMKDYASIMCGVNFEQSQIFKSGYWDELHKELEEKKGLFPVDENFNPATFDKLDDGQIVDAFRRSKLWTRLNQVVGKYSGEKKDAEGKVLAQELLKAILLTGSDWHKELEKKNPSKIGYFSSASPSWVLRNNSLFSQQGWIYFLNKFKAHRHQTCARFLQPSPMDKEQEKINRRNYRILFWMTQLASSALTNVQGIDLSSKLAERILVTEHWPINPYYLVFQRGNFTADHDSSKQWPTIKRNVENYYVDWLKKKGELNYLLKKRFNQLPKMGELIPDKDPH